MTHDFTNEPERVFLQPRQNEYGSEGRLWCQDNAFECEEGDIVPEYIRLDLHQNAVKQAKQDGVQEGRRLQAIKDAEIAKKHKGSAEKRRRATHLKMSSLSEDDQIEILAEERGQNIASDAIAAAIAQDRPMNPQIRFKVPRDVAAIAAVIANYSGAIEYVVPESEEIAVSILRELRNSITIKFELPVDPLDSPLDGIHAIASILETMAIPYVYIVGHFENHEHGFTTPGRIVISDNAGKREYPLPIEIATPHLDVRTLVAAGVDPRQAVKIIGSP